MPRVFTYGPDALQAKMYDRIGATEFVSGAVLPSHRLVFDKPNMKDDREGLVNFTEDPDHEVRGGLFEITRRQLEVLDGYFGGYGQQDVRVVLPDGETEKAVTWVARRTKRGLLPSFEAVEDSRKALIENGVMPEPDPFDGMETLPAPEPRAEEEAEPNG